VTVIRGGGCNSSQPRFLKDLKASSFPRRREKKYSAEMRWRVNYKFFRKATGSNWTV